MMEKLHTVAWFARRPAYWAHAVELAARKFRADHDGPEFAHAARAWAAERAVAVTDALAAVGLDAGAGAPVFPAALIEEGKERARSAVRMGGPGDVNLLHAATALSGARRIVETGVAYGWSSFAILAALDDKSNARLVSVDMPYPKMNNEAFVGVVVPDRYRNKWEIVREPDRHGLNKAIARHAGSIDLCHYDSDKSWRGRAYGYARLWEALSPGGIFISDDIQDNMAFAEFVGRHGSPFAITAFENKYVGITRKP